MDCGAVHLPSCLLVVGSVCHCNMSKTTFVFRVRRRTVFRVPVALMFIHKVIPQGAFQAEVGRGDKETGFKSGWTAPYCKPFLSLLPELPALSTV